MTAPSCVIPLVSASEFFRGLPRFFFSFCILFSPLCLIGISRNKGLGDFPQQAYVFLTFCGTKYYACYFCRTVVRFLPEHFSFAQAFAVLQRILHRHSVGDFVLTLQREMLFENKFILSVLGAVIAQFGRQFYENGVAFSVWIWYNDL